MARASFFSSSTIKIRIYSIYILSFKTEFNLKLKYRSILLRAVFLGKVLIIFLRYLLMKASSHTALHRNGINERLSVLLRRLEQLEL